MEAGLCQVIATHTPTPTCYQGEGWGYHGEQSSAWQCTLVCPHQTQQHADRGTKTSSTALLWQTTGIPLLRPTWGKGYTISGRPYLHPAPALTCLIMCLAWLLAHWPNTIGNDKTFKQNLISNNYLFLSNLFLINQFVSNADKLIVFRLGCSSGWWGSSS